jgi:hypothetical protein
MTGDSARAHGGGGGEAKGSGKTAIGKSKSKPFGKKHALRM